MCDRLLMTGGAAVGAWGRRVPSHSTAWCARSRPQGIGPVVGVDPVAPLLEYASGMLKREMAAPRLRRACRADKRELFSEKKIAFDRQEAVGSYIVFRSDFRLLSGPFQTAEQGARANAHSCHAACYGSEIRNEAMDL
jgi:hypothetical protein